MLREPAVPWDATPLSVSGIGLFLHVKTASIWAPRRDRVFIFNVPSRQYASCSRGWWGLDEVNRPVLPANRQLLFKRPDVAALRALVATINDFTCQMCDDRIPDPPQPYDGIETLFFPDGRPLVIDHALSRANGGTNHPDNLQPLCGSCNTRKGSWLDKRIRRALRRGELAW